MTADERRCRSGRLHGGNLSSHPGMLMSRGVSTWRSGVLPGLGAAPSLPRPPATAAGVSDRLLDMADIVALIEARAEPPKPHGPYKTKARGCHAEPGT